MTWVVPEGGSFVFNILFDVCMRATSIFFMFSFVLS